MIQEAKNVQLSHQQQEFDKPKALLSAQPVIIQRFLEIQGQAIADAIISKKVQVRFLLPDRVKTRVKSIGQDAEITIPAAMREQTVGSFADRILGREVREKIIVRLNELEQSPDQAISVSAGLLRYTASSHMISNMLPAGRTVTYLPDGDEEIPTIPAGDDLPESAITQASDAIAEEGTVDTGRGDLQVPFVPAARKFYLPQWVAFDESGNLLVGSADEAEGYVKSMQQYAMILHRAVSLTPYMVANEEYQRKRYGILGQLINQGRALANYRTAGIINTIKARAENHNLNRGLSISLPYFDDQTLSMEKIELTVIPAGRIMFVPGFVVRASLGEQAKVAQDTRLNLSTRKHLLTQLKSLEMAFTSNE